MFIGAVCVGCGVSLFVVWGLLSVTFWLLGFVMLSFMWFFGVGCLGFLLFGCKLLFGFCDWIVVAVGLC